MGYKEYDVWMSHGDPVSEMPIGFDVIAQTEGANYATIANEGLRIYGGNFIQSSSYSRRKTINKKFCKRYCCKNTEYEVFSQYKINILKNDIGNGKVLCGLSEELIHLLQLLYWM